MIGTRVGQYEIIEEIGKGGMATVFRAYQPSVGRFVAVKVIHRSIAGDRRAVERFQREARLIARLEHPHLLPIYDFDGSHEPPYIVMRYLEGGTLKDVLDQGVIPLTEVAFIMRQIASALDYAHRIGIVHRDIKPSNIMIDADGNAFLMDFGIARLAESGEGLTQTGFAVGTPGYMSPEQGMGLEHVDHRADIYSLGVMLFQMVTGQMPFNAETPMAVILKHLNEPVPLASSLNASVPRQLDALITKAMAKQPEDRYQTASDLSDDITRTVGKTSGNIRPLFLRRAAQNVIARIEQDRAVHKPQIERTMALFEAARASATRGHGPDPQLHVATSRTPTDPYQVRQASSAYPVPAPRGRGVSATWIAAIVALVLFVAVVGVFISRSGILGGAGETPGVTPQTAATSTPAALVLIQSETPTPMATDTGAPAPTDTEASAATNAAATTGVPTEPIFIVNQPTETVTLSPSDTPAPNDMATHTPAGQIIIIGEPTETATLSPSDTPAPSDTATETATDAAGQIIIIGEPTETETPLPAETPTPTSTKPPKATETATDAAGQIIIIGEPTETETPLPAESPTPTETATAVVTPTETEAPTSVIVMINTATDTPLPTDTPTPETARAQAMRDLVVRAGPGSQYPAVTTLSADESREILGLSEDGSWFEVLLPNGAAAWLSAAPALVETSGNLRSVPIAFAPTETPTDTPPPTVTPSDTPTPLPTATETPLPTSTATDVPTSTPLPTSAPTATETPTVPPTEVALALAGRFPFLADFETDAPLEGWDFDPTGWFMLDEAGEHFLVGQAELSQPLAILGDMSPEWLDTPDLAISYRFNLNPNASGARLIFRESAAGYNVLEVKPGAMTLSRSAQTPDMLQPGSERVLQTQTVPIGINRWHNVLIWADGVNIFVYLDNKLTMMVEDLTPPQLSGGRILLQLAGSLAPVRFDDFIIQKAEPPSGHFAGAGIPPTWNVSNPTLATLGQENSGNQYLRMEGDVVVYPSVRPIADLSLTYRIYINQGGYQLRIRQSEGGSMLLDFVGGVMTVTQYDGAGNLVAGYQGVQFYNRQRWEEVTVQFVGNRLRVYRDAQVRFEQLIDNPLPAGTIEFRTRQNDVIGLDDVLITEGATASNEVARVAYALNEEALARPFRELRSDLAENFDDRLRTAVWWEGERSAAGEFTEIAEALDHRFFLRMTHQGAPTYRLMRSGLGVEIFRSGADTVHYTNSSDLLVTVDVRFPDGATGTAWLMTRATAADPAVEPDGFRLEVRRNADGTTEAIARYVSGDQQEVFYEGPVPELTGDPAQWISLEIFTLRDQVYFLVNNRFVASGDGRLALGGTLALGVAPGTTADFDTLIVRDTSPHDA